MNAQQVADDTLALNLQASAAFLAVCLQHPEFNIDPNLAVIERQFTPGEIMQKAFERLALK